MEGIIVKQKRVPFFIFFPLAEGIQAFLYSPIRNAGYFLHVKTFLNISAGEWGRFRILTTDRILE
jgi:hypothetical protein